MALTVFVHGSLAAVNGGGGGVGLVGIGWMVVCWGVGLVGWLVIEGEGYFFIYFLFFIFNEN